MLRLESKGAYVSLSRGGICQPRIVESREEEYILFEAVDDVVHIEVTGAVWPRYVTAGSESGRCCDLLLWKITLKSHFIKRGLVRTQDSRSCDAVKWQAPEFDSAIISSAR